ncbi:large ribosomal subunit protein bL17m [Ostrinia nubilalis]|uniref:39S ribosomal protein L17, mitochondrial n=1 Tax=Ostrinia furnacalis TaxID=93504 RepID=UPI00103D1038|nr:39S ribosomal protein L17, mitochondrial [Ostrinia furnacalis]
MNQADVSKLVSKLRIKVPTRHRNLKNVKGPEGRLDKLRKTVTGLIKYERIELNHNRGDEARQYAERLISEAIRYGDCHKPTMDVANFWLLEKELVHKLFKVLVPRFENCNTAFTRMLNAPRVLPSRCNDKVVLELRGNPYPSLVNRQSNNRQLIQNVLLDAAKYDYRQSKYAEMAEKIGKAEETQASMATSQEPSKTSAESKTPES